MKYRALHALTKLLNTIQYPARFAFLRLVAAQYPMRIANARLSTFLLMNAISRVSHPVTTAIPAPLPVVAATLADGRDPGHRLSLVGRFRDAAPASCQAASATGRSCPAPPGSCTGDTGRGTHKSAGIVPVRLDVSRDRGGMTREMRSAVA